MKRTTNYALPTWEKSDFIQMSDFNDLTQKTDAALKANADAAGGKADGAATSAALAALTKNLGAAGHNCRIAFGEYTGTGTTGADNPNVLNFDFYPVLLVVASATRANSSNRPHFFLRPRTVANSPYAGTSEPSRSRSHGRMTAFRGMSHPARRRTNSIPVAPSTITLCSVMIKTRS